MRKMHELKIPDTIINAIDAGGHEMDLQIVFTAEKWKQSDSWGKRKSSEFKDGELVFISFYSAENGTYGYSIGFTLKGDGYLNIHMLGGLTISDEEGNPFNADVINITFEAGETNNVIISDALDFSNDGMIHDTINIYKL